MYFRLYRDAKTLKWGWFLFTVEGTKHIKIAHSIKDYEDELACYQEINVIKEYVPTAKIIDPSS